MAAGRAAACVIEAPGAQLTQSLQEVLLLGSRAQGEEQGISELSGPGKLGLKSRLAGFRVNHLGTRRKLRCKGRCQARRQI